MACSTFKDALCGMAQDARAAATSVELERLMRAAGMEVAWQDFGYFGHGEGQQQQQQPSIEWRPQQHALRGGGGAWRGPDPAAPPLLWHITHLTVDPPSGGHRRRGRCYRPV